MLIRGVIGPMFEVSGPGGNYANVWILEPETQMSGIWTPGATNNTVREQDCNLTEEGWGNGCCNTEASLSMNTAGRSSAAWSVPSVLLQDLCQGIVSTGR